MNSEKTKINIDGNWSTPKHRGTLHRSFGSFYDNGNIQHSGQYENGLMEGVWKYPDGKILTQISHLMGRPSGLNETFMRWYFISRGFSEEEKG